MYIHVGQRYILFLFTVILLLGFVACRSDTTRGRRSPTAVPPAAGDVERLASPVQSVRVLTEDGGRLDWSPNLNLIVFDRPNAEGYFQLYTMNADGSNQQCVLCDKPGAPSRHRGNPAWHPSGNWIVFQAEKEQHRGLSASAHPGFGIDNNLWLTSRDGNTILQLTDVPERMGVLHPHFSHDGSKLFWSERVGEGDSLRDRTGKWVMRIADFVEEDGSARLENIQTYQPFGEVFYESHSFSPDDSKVLFTAFIQPSEEHNAWLDIFSLDLTSGESVALTQSIDVWDEHAHFSPSGNKIVWMSSKGCECNAYRVQDLYTDLWLMNSDTTNPLQITHVSDPNYPEFTFERSIAADSAWSPDGQALALFVIEGTSGFEALRRSVFGGRILLVEFDSPQ